MGGGGPGGGPTARYLSQHFVRELTKICVVVTLMACCKRRRLVSIAPRRFNPRLLIFAFSHVYPQDTEYTQRKYANISYNGNRFALPPVSHYDP